MATPPASGGQPEQSTAPLASNSGVQHEAAPQTQELTEDAASEYRGSKRKRPSPVWDYFAKEKVDGVWKAQCIRCEKYISGETKAGPGTAHLMEHLDNCIGESWEGGKTQTSLRLGSGEQKKVSVESDVSDGEVARKALYSKFILHAYPLSIADHLGLRTFVDAQALQPFSEIVTVNTTRKDIFGNYEMEKKKVLNYLQKNNCRVAVSTELWTDSKKRGYMAVIGHFTDECWKHRGCILWFIHVPCPRTSDVLCEALCKCLQSWDLDRKISTLNLDNYSTGDALIPLIEEKIGPANLLLGGKMLHMGCCAHNLNSVVKDGLEVIWTEIGRIRDSVAYCLATPKRYEKFEEAAQSQQVELTEKLCLDCKTRWNSTYIMLRVALLYMKVFDRQKQIDKHFTSCPTAEEWAFASSVCDRLKCFHNLSEMFSGAKYVTANIFFLHICEIKLKMQEWLGCGDPIIEKMSVAMIGNFDKYWSDFHGLMALATILDPRGHTAMLHFCYGALFGKENAEYHVQKSCDFLCELVNEYKKVESEEKGMATSSCGLSSSNGDKKVASIFDDFIASMTAYNVEWAKNELDNYLEYGSFPYTDKEFDILGWWKVCGTSFPTSRRIARDIFAVPITSVASESALSTGGRVLSGHYSCLTPEMLEALICSQDWLRDELQGEEGPRASNMLGRH